ncbi:MAG: hypothetical protein HPY69_12215 [Armatimonadetes bacterium]|nr:hypothetical protein [Armatimonadota bacterium]
MQRRLRLVAPALAALVVVPLTGCLKLDAQFVAQPDLGFAATILIGMDARLMESMGSGAAPLADLKSGPLGQAWSVREFERDGWRYVEAKGVGPAGTALLGDYPGAPEVQVDRAMHRLTTRYSMTWRAQEMPLDALPSPSVPGDASDSQQPEMPDLQTAVEVMLSGLEVRLALGGPGHVVSTNGTVVGEGLAEWHPTVHEIASGETPTLQVVTETINWTHLGRLADQIAGLGGGYAAGTRLADAVTRGLLPNPPASAIGAGKLEAADYSRLLAIITRLDEVLERSETAVVMRELGLSSDSATSGQIAAVYAKTQAPEFIAQLRTARVRQAVEGLRP